MARLERQPAWPPDCVAGLQEAEQSSWKQEAEQFSTAAYL